MQADPQERIEVTCRNPDNSTSTEWFVPGSSGNVIIVGPSVSCVCRNGDNAALLKAFIIACTIKGDVTAFKAISNICEFFLQWTSSL